MSEREQDIPGAVVITPQQQFDMMLALRDEVKHLSSVVDPALAQIRIDVAANSGRIDIESEQRKAADEKLGEHVRVLQTAGFVTSTRMWTVVAVLATAVVAIITAVTYLQQT